MDVAGPRRVALVVGLNRYAPEEGLHDLRFAAADAEAVGGRLSDAGYEVHTVLHTATRQGFLDAFDDATAALQRDDLFLLYFAGHAQLEAGGGEDDLALLFSDDSGADGDGLAVEALAERVEGVAAKHRVVLLDTCYSERTRQQLALRRGSTPVAVPRVGAFDAWIFSAAPQQSAQEDPALGHGVFTWYLLEALDGEADADGDGVVGVLEVYNWVGFKTAEHTGRAQVPWIEESRIGWDDLGLVTVGSSAPSAALPWYERVLPGSSVLIDGISRGPGSVEAGRHAVEVRDGGGELVLKRQVAAREGQVLEWDRWLEASASQLRVGAGAGWIGRGDRQIPAVSASVAGWWLPRSAVALRPVLGARGSLGRSQVDSGRVDLSVATARGGLGWQPVPAVVVGPWAGVGGTWLRTVGGVGAAPLLESGALVQVEVGPAWIGLEGGVQAWSAAAEAGGWTAHPTAGLTVGATLR